MKRLKTLVTVFACLALLVVIAGCSKSGTASVQKKLDIATKANDLVNSDTAQFAHIDGTEVDQQGSFLTARNDIVGQIKPLSSIPQQPLDNMTTAVSDLEKTVMEHQVIVTKLAQDVKSANKANDAVQKAADDAAWPEASTVKAFVQRSDEQYSARLLFENSRLGAIRRQLDSEKNQLAQFNAMKTTDAAAYNAAVDAYNKYRQEMFDGAKADEKSVGDLGAKAGTLNQEVLRIITKLEKAGLDFKRPK